MAANVKSVFENGMTHPNLRTRHPFKFSSLAGRKRKWTADVRAWILCFIVYAAGCHGYEEQRFAMEPQDQSAIVGSRVTLPCRVEHKAGALQWTKDDFGLGTHRNLTGYDRYSMIGSDDEDFSLDIRDVTLDDDGRYQCQVSGGLNGEPAIRSRYAQLTILVAPDPPRIVQGAFIDATENQAVDIECESVGGKPAAEITWLDGSQAVIKKNVKVLVELMPDEQRFRTRSVLRLKPGKSHHNQTITCQAQNTADRAPRMATVHVEVKYVPKVSTSVSSGQVNGSIREGSEARVRCDVDSNPPPQMYKWYIDSNPVVGDYAEEMIIFNVSRKHHKAEVKCEVSNTVGTGEGNLRLNVSYPPTFRQKPENIEADLGSRVVLNCDVDGQPEPTIRWLLHEPGRIGVTGKSPKLVIENLTPEKAGRYVCKATVKGYPKIETEATVFIKEAPTILSNRTQFGTEGESVRVECAAISVPKPDDVTWFFEGREISVIQDPDYAILRESLPNGIYKSTLVIRASQSKHFGLYNCSVSNDHGTANAGILLKPLKSLPLFIILIGVTSGIVIFSAFIILLVICHRRRRKKSQQMSEKPDVTVTTGDMYKESDRSSNVSDLKMHLPQSDGSYELDYTGSDRSDTKMPAGLPLAGPVPLPNVRLDDFSYSNDYSDPAYNDYTYKAPAGYIYDYPHGYAPPPHLRVQSPTQLEVPPANRSLQGSLTRSIDTASTLPLSNSNGSQNNSLQRTNKPEETDTINNLGLPTVGSEAGPQTPIYATPSAKPQPGVDLRYSATYGNPYLRNSSIGYGSQVNTAKPTATPAPPPYSAVRNSVVMPATGNGNTASQATHV